MLNLGKDEMAFKRCVFRKLRTSHSLEAKGFGKKNKENAMRLLESLNGR